MKKEKPIYTDELEKTLKEFPSTLNHLKAMQAKVIGYSAKSGNPIVPMKSFKKHELGGLYVGIRVGNTSSHLRIGTLIRGYYTVNHPFWNQAYILKCEDGKERVYQFIRKIEQQQIEQIKKQREAYIGKK